MAELPFILMHPKPEDNDDMLLVTENGSSNVSSQPKNQNVSNDKEHAASSSIVPTKDDAPNLIQLDG